MTLTLLQAVRGRIQDPFRAASVVLYGDGITTRFDLTHSNIQSGTAYVQPGGTAWSATAGATFNTTGFVTFTDRVSANSAIRLDYVHSVFSDTELGYFTGIGGNVPGAALEAVRWLLFDGLKRMRWMSPDGAMADDTAAIGLLRALESGLKYEIEQDATSGGSLDSWGESQQNWW